MNFISLMFWGFLFLIVPLGIHLWSRKKPELIRFPTIKYLENKQIRKARNIKLTEIPLLLLRMSILILLILFLSQLVYETKESTSKKAAVYPEDIRIVSELALELEQDSLRGYELMSYNDIYTTNRTHNHWILINELDKQGYDSILMYTHGYFEGFSGTKPEPTSIVVWKLIPELGKNDSDSEIYVQLSDSTALKVSNSGNRYQKTKSSRTTSEFDFSEYSVVIITEDSMNTSFSLVKAALKSIESWVGFEMDVRFHKDANKMIEVPDLLIALDEVNLQDNLKAFVKFTPDIPLPRVEYLNDSEIFTLPTSLLTSTDAIDGKDLSQYLFEIIFREVYDLPLEDHRTYNSESLPVLNSLPSVKTSGETIEVFKYILLLLLVLLLVERYYSNLMKVKT